MMPGVTVVITNGTVDVSDTSAAAIGEQRLVDRMNPGFGGRTFKHRRLFRVGERVTLPAGEAARLAQAGIVAIVP
jgi:hypothetical protein